MAISALQRYSPLVSTQSLLQTQRLLSSSIGSMASGTRQDAASARGSQLVISERMRYTVRSMSQSITNAQIGSAQLEVAGGGMSSQTESLQRMRELAVQAANGSLTAADRAHLNAEYQQHMQQMDGVAQQTAFNGQKLLDGSFSRTFHVGANANQTVNVSIGDMSAAGVGVAGTSLATQAGANQAIADIDQALANVGTQSARVGAAQNRLDSVVSAQFSAFQNLLAAESQIRDANVAEEVSNLVRAQLMQEKQTGLQRMYQINRPSIVMMMMM
jgi:flagellin